MRSALALLLAIAPSVASALHRGPSVASRRSLLVGAAASLSLSGPAVFPVAALRSDDFEELKERARMGQLTTDNVIIRAMRDDLLDPKDFQSLGRSTKEECRVLDSLMKVDVKAANEVKTANKALLKMRAAAGTAERGKVSEKATEALKESYDFGRIIEGRIRERASVLNVKYVVECEDSGRREDRDRDR